MKKKRKWVIIIAAALILVLIFVLPMFRAAKSIAYRTDTARRGSISTYYSFSGAMELSRQETHTAYADCEVREVYVSEGDMVGKDDRIMRLSDGHTIKAGMEGEVTELPFKKDDRASAGEVLAGISDFSSMRVSFDVDEFDVDAVKVGADASVTIDALDCAFVSPITRISKTAHTSGDISYYTARIEPAAGALPEAALPGMRVDVKTLGAHADDVIMLKMEALSFDEYNKPYVYVQNGDAKERRYVSTGINDGVYVEITDGLSEGETVYYIARAAMFGMMPMRPQKAERSR